MASTSTYMSASANFKMPLEPAPVPSITRRSSSDEESFVVLGKSLADFDESAISLDQFSEVNSFGVNIIQEAQQLISQELAQMEKKVLTAHEVELAEKPVENQQSVEQPGFGKENSHDAVSESNNEEAKTLSLMPPTEKSLMASPQDGNKLISIISISPSEIVSEELQQKISQLIDENIQLKDTILQNNVNMKAQYERIVAWQEDVQKVHETHKEKFVQAKQYIEALKKENYNLKQEIEKLMGTIVAERSKNAEQKQQLMESSVINIKEFELEAITKKLKQELDAANQKLSENNNAALWQEEILKNKKELEEAYKKIQELEVEVQRMNSLAETELEQTISQMKNVELNKDNSTFELEKKLNASEQTVAQLKLTVDEYKNEIFTLKEVINAKNMSLSEIQSRLNEEQHKFEETNTGKQQLETNMKNILGELEEAKIEAWRSKTREAEKERAYMEQIQTLKASLTSCNTYQQTPSPYYELENLKQQLMQSQIALTNCEHARNAAAGQVQEYRTEIADLNSRLQELSSQGDLQFVLREQLDVYKADFDDEKAAKEQIKLEKEQLSEDLQHLHRRNQQLQEEIEMLRRQVPEGFQAPSRSTEAPTLASQAEQPGSFKCPKCNFGFYTLNACENHVMRCIELEDSLP